MWVFFKLHSFFSDRRQYSEICGNNFFNNIGAPHDYRVAGGSERLCKPLIQINIFLQWIQRARALNYGLLLADRPPEKFDYLCCTLCWVTSPYCNMSIVYAASSFAQEVEWLEKIDCSSVIFVCIPWSELSTTDYSRLSKHSTIQTETECRITYIFCGIACRGELRRHDSIVIVFILEAVIWHETVVCTKLSIQAVSLIVYPAKQRIRNWCYSKFFFSFWSWLKLGRCVDICCELWVSKKQ